MRRRWIVVFIAVAALVVVLFLFFRRRPPSEEERIRNAFEEARIATAERRIRDLMRFVDKDYTDNEGNTRDVIRQIATLYLLRASKVSIKYAIRSIEVQRDRAKVSIRITASLSDSGERTDMDLVLEMAKRESEWKVVRAAGVRINADQ